MSSAVAAEMVRSVIDEALDTPDGVARLAPPQRSSRWRYFAIAAAAVFVFSVGSGASAVAWRLLHLELGEAELGPQDQAGTGLKVAPSPVPEPIPQEVVVPPAIVEGVEGAQQEEPRQVRRKKIRRGPVDAPRGQAVPGQAPSRAR
jgi:hypothetical protein